MKVHHILMQNVFYYITFKISKIRKSILTKQIMVASRQLLQGLDSNQNENFKKLFFSVCLFWQERGHVNNTQQDKSLIDSDTIKSSLN